MSGFYDILDGVEDEMIYLDFLKYDSDKRLGVIVERGDPLEDLGDRKFEEKFRVSKGTVLWLLKQMKKSLEFPTKRNHPMSPINRILTTLRAYATGSFNIVIGDTVNVHRSTALRIITDVSDIMSSFFPRYISFPKKPELRSVMSGFQQIDGFPGVVGTIDCTQIRIQHPGGDNAEQFRNKKGHFSLNCQTISDHNLIIRDIVARWPGSVPKHTVFQKCALRALLENDGVPHGHLLGDNGYECQSYLLTPLLNPRTSAEQRYNRSHMKTLNTIEMQQQAWKRRFPILSLGLRCGLEKAMMMITATAVLQNIARTSSTEEPPDDPEIMRLLEQSNSSSEPDNLDAAEPSRELIHDKDALPGIAVRQAIIKKYFS